MFVMKLARELFLTYECVKEINRVDKRVAGMFSAWLQLAIRLRSNPLKYCFLSRSMGWFLWISFTK